MYMGNGIAYRSLVGLPERESDLKTFRFRAEVYLMLAMVVQLIGVSLLVRRWSARLPAISGNIVLREGFPLAIGLISVAFVFIAVRGL
jgi:hypothetical protein